MGEHTLHETGQAAERQPLAIPREERGLVARTLSKNMARASVTWHLIRVLELIDLAQRADALNCEPQDEVSTRC